MSKETFTNRHGVTSVIDKDEVVTQISPEMPEKIVEKKPKKKSPKKSETIAPAPVVESHQLQVTKKPFPWRVIRFGAVALIALVLILMVFSQANISGYDSAQKDMKTAVAKAKNEKIKTDVDLASVVSTLQKDLPAMSCPEQSLSIQFTTRAKNTIKSCQDTQAAYNGVRKNLDELKVIAGYGTLLSDALKPALTNVSDGSFANISDSTAKWHASQEKIKTITPPTRLKEAHKTIVDSVSTVAASWQKLQDADAARDTDAYETAKTELSNSYDALRKVSEGVMRDTLPLQKQLLAQINAF